MSIKEEEQDEQSGRTMGGRNPSSIFVLQGQIDRWMHQLFWCLPGSKSSPEYIFTTRVLIKSVKRLRYRDNIILSFVRSVYYSEENTDQGGTGGDKLSVVWETRRKIVHTLDDPHGSHPPRSTLLGKGYVSCLDGDERILRAHGSEFFLSVLSFLLFNHDDICDRFIHFHTKNFPLDLVLSSIIIHLFDLKLGSNPRTGITWWKVVVGEGGIQGEGSGEETRGLGVGRWVCVHRLTDKCNWWFNIIDLFIFYKNKMWMSRCSRFGQIGKRSCKRESFSYPC